MKSNIHFPHLSAMFIDNEINLEIYMCVHVCSETEGEYFMGTRLGRLLVQAIENCPHVFWLLDVATGRHVYVSKAYEEVWSRTRKSIYVCPHSFLESVHPDDYLRAVVMFDMQLRGEPTLEEFRVIGPDGSVRRIRSECLRIRSLSPRRTFMLGVAQDITAMRHMNSAGQDAWMDPHLLIAGVAHDFGNVLTAVIGNGELLMKTVGMNSEARSRVQSILRAGSTGKSLTTELIDSFRLSLPQIENVNLNSIVTDDTETMKSIAGNQITLTVTIPQEATWVCASAQGLTRILLNLVSNAQRAMPHGGEMKIIVHGTDQEEPVRQRKLAFPPRYHFAILQVTDDGCGMNFEAQKHVFQPFFTTKTNQVGAGLGLYTVRRIVDQCGGEIRFISAPGKGTSFYICLRKVE